MGLSDLFALFVCYTVVCDHWFFNPPITTPKRNIDEYLEHFDLKSSGVLWWAFVVTNRQERSLSLA